MGALRSRREERAVAVFGTWMLCGLFLDGWAHDAEKPETFFSPWHGILYSGFLAAVLWFAWDGWRRARAGLGDPAPTDRMLSIGVIVFVIGAVGDGLWHEIFGIEVDLEALVSPSHLALFFGGFLMLTTPVRAALPFVADEPEPTWKQFAPQAITITLAAALVLFFTQYLTPFEYIGTSTTESIAGEHRQIVDLAAVLATTVVLVTAALFILVRWRPPIGTMTLLFGVNGVLLAGLEGFETGELVVAFVLTGFAADLLVARAAPIIAVNAAATAVLWSAFFAAADWSYGIAWSAELWAGAIVLATGAATLLSALPARSTA